MPLPKAILFISIPGFCASAYSAKPDCARTQTQVEALICKDAELQERDAELSAIHKIVIDMDNTIQKPDMEAERDAWFRNVRNKCRDADCLRDAYEARLNKLTVVNTTPPKAHYVVNRERFLSQLSAFQSSLSWVGIPGKLSDCKMMIRLDETAGSSQDTGHGGDLQLEHARHHDLR